MILDRFIEKRLAMQLRTAALRAYAAARVSNTSYNWKGTYNSLDADIKADLEKLRARARDLAQNNPHVKRYFQLLKMNVAGPNGFKLQANVRETNDKIDEVANLKVEEAFGDWSLKDNCSLNGQYSLKDITYLCLEHLGRDGEYLLLETRGGKYGYQLQALEPDLLDLRHNTQLANGNTVYMGVELDEYRRPVNYYLKDIPLTADSPSFQYTNKHKIIPASRLIHGFLRESAFQTRGVPTIAPVMLVLNQLGEYQTAAVTKARAGATSLGFLIPSIDNYSTLSGTPDEDNNVIINLDPMSVNQLEPGMEFKNWENEYPSEQFDSFVKAVLRTVAVGLNVSYHSLTGDLSAANYSSARVGMLDEREGYKQLQNYLVDSVLMRVYKNWLPMALLSKNLNLPFSMLERLTRVSFIGRTWDWIDPKNEAEGAMAEIRAGMDTLTNKLAEKGKDIVDVFKQLKEEKELANKYGLNLTTVNNGLTPEPDEEPPYKAEETLKASGNGNGKAVPLLSSIP